MKTKDYFFTQEEFEIQETDIEGIYKTSPIPENIEKYYESNEYISHHQDKKGFKEKIYKWFQKINLNYKYNIISSRIPKNGKILDYGCGAGDFLKFLEMDFITIGYEPNLIAKNAAIKKTKNTNFINQLSEIEDNSINAITLWHVLEHLQNKDEIIEILYKKLISNGYLIIAVPNPDSFDAKKYKKYWAAYDVPRHIWHFTQKGMRNWMQTKNWKIETIKPLLLDSFYISILSEKYKKNPLYFIFGSVFGAISNFKATKSKEFSSLIYIIKKK